MLVSYVRRCLLFGWESPWRCVGRMGKRTGGHAEGAARARRPRKSRETDAVTVPSSRTLARRGDIRGTIRDVGKECRRRGRGRSGEGEVEGAPLGHSVTMSMLIFPSTRATIPSCPIASASLPRGGPENASKGRLAALTPTTCTITVLSMSRVSMSAPPPTFATTHTPLARLVGRTRAWRRGCASCV